MIDISRKVKKAIVTGGAGFIGSHIVEELLKQGITVVSIDNFVAGKKENIEGFLSDKNFTSIKCDVTDFNALEPHFADVDVVFHEAASKFTVCLEDPRKDLDVNAKGTFNVLEAVRKHKVKKIVHASTGSVYGEPQYFPEDEKHPTHPSSFYGTSKLAGETYCRVFARLYDINFTVLRYFHVYGSRQESSDYGGVIPIFIRRVFNGQNPVIFGDGSQVRSFTYVKDVVKANFYAAITPEMDRNYYNCASGIKVTIKELAHYILKHFDRDDLAPIYKDWRPGDIKEFIIENSKLKNVAFDTFTGFDEGLRETVAWYRAYLSKKAAVQA